MSRILQLSSEDLNQSTSPLKISYHYISSVTVSSSNRHPVCAGCMLPRHVLLGHLDPWRWDQLDIPKRWNGITILCCAQSQKIAGLKTCSISVCPSIRRMQNSENIYIYVLTLLQKMSNRVKSHDLPGQGIGPALSTQHCCSSFKSFFVSKNHQTWGFHLLIPHKQNPHTEINQLAVTAKIISQPGIQLCVTTVAVQSWQTDFHGLHERLPWLVQHSCLIWTQIILVIHQRWEKHSNYIIVQWTGHPASRCVFSNSRHCSLSACIPTVWL